MGNVLLVGVLVIVIIGALALLYVGISAALAQRIDRNKQV